MSKFYVTTPIYYINDVPSVGSAYTTIAADVLARWHRMKGDDVFFLTGLDENSIKTVQAAKAKGIEDLQRYTDEMAEKWVAAWKVLNISYDDFVRTTQERHKKNVREFLKKVYEKGDIYKGKYEGLYCEGCEAFYLEKDLVNGHCPLHKTPPKQLSEENYFFKLSKYGDAILDYIQKNPEFIQPVTRREEMVKFAEGGLKDISISRPLKWGIPLPIDEKHVVWVWFDALINYLLPEKYWPADVHVIGKDILRFHALIWPGMLLSAGVPLPKKIFAHGFFTIAGQKISKSLGNVIDPVHLANKYSTDALRYFLFREIHFGDDGDFSEDAIKSRYNNELVANYSNLFYRVTLFVEKNFGGFVPKPSEFGNAENALRDKISAAIKEADEAIENLKLTEALAAIMALSDEANKYFQKKEPWKTVKANKEDAATACYVAVNALRIISTLLHPYIPEKSGKALKNLGISEPTMVNITEFVVAPGQKISPGVLFKTIR